jgi:riboflavin transporter FmnP
VQGFFYKLKKENTMKKHINVHKIVGVAMFASLAFVLSLIFRFPVMFLTFDVKDAVITLSGFIFGPICAVVTSLLAATIELSISDTGVYGFIMNFASSATFSFAASMIYKYKRTFFGSVIGFYSASAILVAVMIGLNILVTPFYMGVPRSVVIDMLDILFMFNAAKALMNSAIAMLFYKPVITALRRARLIKTKDSNPDSEKKSFFNRFTAYTVIFALVTVAVAITLFVILKLDS